jgi:hypothetical protein
LKNYWILKTPIIRKTPETISIKPVRIGENVAKNTIVVDGLSSVSNLLLKGTSAMPVNTGKKMFSPKSTQYISFLDAIV